MVYLEYIAVLGRYLDAQKVYESILVEKETLFQRTQPKSANMEDDKVKGTHTGNTFEDYVIAKEKKQLDQRLDEARSILDDRGKLVNLKLEELRQSNAIEDKIYRYRHIDYMAMWKIARLVNYSEMQVYRIHRKMLKDIQEVRKC